MIGEIEHTITDYVVALLGTYSPIQVGSECYIDWSYMIAGALLCIACWFCFRGFLVLLKGLLGGGNYA